MREIERVKEREKEEKRERERDAVVAEKTARDGETAERAE